MIFQPRILTTLPDKPTRTYGEKTALRRQGDVQP